MLILYHNDLCSSCETPAGARGRGDPAGALAPRRLPLPPAESEAPGAQINNIYFHSTYKIFFENKEGKARSLSK
ncbi:hypothetical protein BTR25_03960 [Bacillus sp. MRMR6]|nr:hypothetical protein BTR25_03960 [Bacillus sp. MRMR6]